METAIYIFQSENGN